MSVRVNEVYERNARVLHVSLFKPSESDRLPKLNASLLLFFCGKLFFFTDLSQHGFSIGNPVQALRRTSEGPRELFVQIYCTIYKYRRRNK